MENVNHSYRALRRAIGILGICLPILLVIGNGFNLESSISRFYYTKMSTVFTGILITFGLILFTYRGTGQSGNNKLSENLLTNFGGLFALLVALVPTRYGSDIESLFYVHNDAVRGWVHIVSAVFFIFIMGLVVLIKFTRAKYYTKFYRIMGILVMVGLALAIYAFIHKTIHGQPLFKGAIFWGETLSLWAFGIAWLRRGVPKNKIKD